MAGDKLQEIALIFKEEKDITVHTLQIMGYLMNGVPSSVVRVARELGLRKDTTRRSAHWLIDKRYVEKPKATNRLTLKLNKNGINKVLEWESRLS